ncbi:PTS fructose transporter subunit IIABC [Mycoplasmopsis alligatoris]|uniref:Phosphoenolpyruvate-dependent sugar phosphotransferase system, EIIA 2 n=1 Tax=Mycoplasmopsis alligatoris A21JP2 TaxID=747682 RepID=D4XV95_9BACT|nr:fructose-specific PTS transporter subunit EIIC [Mycoplasmopsis alligatoris]EFF41730.1 phosphoenolpyruvate-dependent sugar phosphotransferase system, EIIA 2 [Mycoplasmopsis alligatoris A21JP2]
MRIKDLLTKETILFRPNINNKDELLKRAVDLAALSGKINDPKKLLQAVWKREYEFSTGVGNGIAIPHGKGEFVKKPVLSAIVLREGIDYSSLDNKPVKLVFLIAAPEGNAQENLHLDVLANLSRMLLDEELVEKLIKAKSKSEFLSLLSNKENELARKEEQKEQNVLIKSNNQTKEYLVAITSCPTGIAHTYMAQESLEKMAKELNVEIKVETQGSGGAKNILSTQEIANAKAVIIAADTNVELNRFEGKRLLKTDVSSAIKNPQNLINRALNDNLSVYKNTDSSSKNNQDKSQQKGFIKTFYTHLMSGVSHMLPFVIGGGILIALAFLIDSFYGTEAIGSNFGSTASVAKFFMGAGGAAFGFMMAILAGFIAFSIAGRPGLAVGMVGGFLANSASFSIINTGSNAGFLGALIAGFVAGYLVLGLRYAFKWMPKSMDGMKPMLVYPVLGILLIALIMYFLINTPLGYLNFYINKGLKDLVESQKEISLTFKIGVGMLLAGMMAVDMGGPINKVAYTIGVASVDPNGLNQPWIMAAVMIGGMVPPLVIALSADLFPQKYSSKERKDSKVNYLMGLSFITEGAIPYAASDPFRVIGASIVGSAVAGGMSAALGASIPAPHGGIFVFAVAQNWYWYLLALAVGAVLGALILGILKKKHPEAELKRWKGIPIGNGVYLKKFKK